MSQRGRQNERPGFLDNARPGVRVQSVGKEETVGRETLKGGKTRRATLSALLAPVLSQYSANSSRFAKPLRTVFLSFLILTASVLTLQNIISQYRNLSEPQRMIVQTAERLLMQQRAYGSQALDRIAADISADSDLQNAIRQKDHVAIRRISDDVFAKQLATGTIAEFSIYAADQKLVYSAEAPGMSSRADASFRSNLTANLFRQNKGIEFGPDNQAVISVLRPWFSDGQLLGYLRLAIDIEQSLALAGSAVDAEIVKICEIASPSGTGATETRYKAIAELSPTGFDFEALNAGDGVFHSLNRFYMNDGRVFMVRNLPISVADSQASIRLVLVKDITQNVWTFLRNVLLSIFAGFGLSLIAWAVIHRLLSRLQSSVEVAQSRLEAEVRDNTQKLELSSLQLLEAQRIAAVGSWEQDLRTNEMRGSEEFYRILNISPDLPAAKIRAQICKRLPFNEIRDSKARIEQAVSTCGEFEFEHTLTFEDGATRFLHIRGYVLAGADGIAARIFGILHDITDRRNAERQNHLLANILESSLNEIYILDAETLQIDYANKCALTNLGYSLEELRSRGFWSINPIYDQKTARRLLAPLLRGYKESLSADSIHIRRNRSEYPVDLKIQMHSDRERRFIVAIANDVSERVQRETETLEAKTRAERLAYFDPLTKLSNRAGCQRDARERFAGEQKPAFLIHVDMDGFKRVNDTLGHLAGDHCLEETGRRLRDVARGLGTPYRWGGDEFVILANDSDSDVNELCERARSVMRMPMEFNGNRFWPTVSMGIALCPEHGADFDTLLVNADLALYQSKESGRDRFSFFSHDLKVEGEKEAEIERELQSAVKNDEFFMVFQPQVNLRSQTLTGIEALVRWQNPARGVVSPAEFLPIVEKSSLAPVLGELVINMSLAAARSWLDAGLEFGRIAINVSQSHLASGQLVDHFKAAMARHRIPPERITAEVVETVFLDDTPSGHVHALTELYELGVHIELDDFGTGYASLSHVSNLPINGLKIDRSFTMEMLDDAKKEAVVNYLIQLARTLNIGVICEGVETDAQYQRLRMMGDFSIQGFLISRPMQYDKMTAWMTETAEDIHFVL